MAFHEILVGKDPENLVGGFHPFEKIIGSFPQVGVKIKNIRNQHLEMVYEIIPI